MLMLVSVAPRNTTGITSLKSASFPVEALKFVASVPLVRNNSAPCEILNSPFLNCTGATDAKGAAIKAAVLFATK